MRTLFPSALTALCMSVSTFAQKSLLTKLDKGELQLAEVQSRTRELFETELAAQTPAKA